jgi:predicted amino acid racemase
MLRGGAKGLADWRLDNVQRMRNSGITAPIMMLRIPRSPKRLRSCGCATSSLNSESAVLEALAEAATEQGLIHDVILMLEMGDRREGVSPETFCRWRTSRCATRH